MGCASSSPVGLAQPGAHLVPSQPTEFWRADKATAAGQFHCDYLLGQKLGAGSFASVYSATRADVGREFAVKVVGQRMGDTDSHGGDSQRRRAIEREVSVSRELPCSPNLVEFYGFYDGEGLSYLVMERCDMDLLPFLEVMPLFSEVALRLVFEDMVSAIATCHGAGVVHRDVKCENFVVATHRGGRGFAVKLCDFGLARKTTAPRERLLAGVCGTAEYMAPEMLRGESYSAAVDIWALGVLVYLLLFGAWPYTPASAAADEDDVKTAILLGSPVPEFRCQTGFPTISAPCAKWVRSLLRRDPTDRPLAEQTLRAQCFSQPWSAAVPPEADVRAAAVRRAVAAARGSSELDRAMWRKSSKRQVSAASTSASGDSLCRLPSTC